jgi:hypothetical protein
MLMPLEIERRIIRARNLGIYRCGEASSTRQLFRTSRRSSRSIRERQFLPVAAHTVSRHGAVL